MTARTWSAVGIGLVVAGLTISASAAEVTVKLNPHSNSGEAGTAKLSDAPGGKTKVVVSVSGQPAAAQPMHIHKGTCANLDPAPAYGLPSLQNGKAEATVDVPLKTLQGGKFAINGHKSAQEAKTYVFCGEIPAQ